MHWNSKCNGSLGDRRAARACWCSRRGSGPPLFVFREQGFDAKMDTHLIAGGQAGAAGAPVFRLIQVRIGKGADAQRPQLLQLL